jgi:hypothetical protein
MAQEERDLLDLLKFELKFLEDGGYGRSPHTPRRRHTAFEDSPTCLNFGDSARPHPCTECLLMRFVPRERREQGSPCRHIPLTDKGETVDYFYRSGTQLALLKLEEALANWLGKQIRQIEELGEAEHSRNNSKGLERIRQQQWLAFAGNLYSLANLHRESHNYVVAHALYGRALAVAERVGVVALGDDGHSLIERIRTNQQEVETLQVGDKGIEQAPSEDLQIAGQPSGS